MRQGSIAFLLTVASAIACGGEAPPPQLPPAPLPAASTSAASAPTAPTQICASQTARAVDATETKFGMVVSDPYRWMENNDNAELTTWLRAQGDCARQYLGRIAGREALDVFVNLLGQLGGGHQVGGDLVVQEVTSNYMAQRQVRSGQHGFMHHAQLATQLRHRACRVDGAQHTLPETAAHRQDGIVIRH